VITASQLKTHTARELAVMAKRRGIPGWHAMRKEELVKALLKLAVKTARPEPGSKSHAGGNHRSAAVSRAKNGTAVQERQGAKARPSRVERRLNQLRAELAQSKDLAFHEGANGNGRGKDRLVVMVRDPYWLQVYWELTRQSVERAQVALGQHWHGAKPVLRLFEVARDGTTNTARKVLRDIDIHGGVNNWYVDVSAPPKSFQIDVGYRTPDGKFFALARSNVVTTPQANCLNSFDGNWAGVAKDFDRVYALSGGYNDHEGSELKDVFEERLRRPMGTPMVARYGLGAGVDPSRREFAFEVDAELIVFGVTDPGAHVTVRGEPVRVKPDGTFSVRLNLPDRRHVLPVVASPANGMEQRTIVLAVERNTKVMETIIREPDA